MKKLNFSGIAFILCLLVILPMAYWIRTLEKQKTTLEWRVELREIEILQRKYENEQMIDKKAVYRTVGGKCETWIPCESVKIAAE